jgi:hypothetical protein
VILVPPDRKDPLGRKAWLASKVQPAPRVPLDQLVPPDRREKLGCKDPQVLKVNAGKSAHPDRLRALLVLSDPQDHPDPQDHRERQGLQETPLQPQTYGHSR